MGTLVRVLQPVDVQSLVSRRLYLRCFRTAHNCSNLVRLACPESLPCSHVGRIMVQRLRVFVLLACAAIEGAHAFQATAQTGGRQSPQDHLAWVAQVLKRMQTIRPGMTREKLLTIFTTEGGLSTPLERKFVSRDCPYFKVDIEFQAVGRPTREAMNG